MTAGRSWSAAEVRVAAELLELRDQLRVVLAAESKDDWMGHFGWIKEVSDDGFTHVVDCMIPPLLTVQVGRRMIEDVEDRLRALGVET